MGMIACSFCYRTLGPPYHLSPRWDPSTPTLYRPSTHITKNPVDVLLYSALESVKDRLYNTPVFIRQIILGLSHGLSNAFGGQDVL